MDSRGNKLLKNTIFALIFQATSIICGFILPRFILGRYGSEVNGLVQSITRFLSIISFLELGVGRVIIATLYKPLADCNTEKISQIVASGEKFFKQIARILIVYVAILIVIFPKINDNSFSWAFTATLIISISISFFAQYYFGVVDRLLLNADQKGYIQYLAQIITLVLNTIASIALINLGKSIQSVKLVSSLIYCIRPIFLKVYVDKKYKINRKVKAEGEPIKQKWNGFASHVSAIVLDEADTIILTVFSTLSSVSIYSVYHMIVYGIKQVILLSTDGFDSIIGEMYAKERWNELRDFFNTIEWWIHALTAYIFSCTIVLLLPFVAVYTKGITDTNYYQPLFGLLLVLANAGHCLRLPYYKMIAASGKFKETQNCFFISAFINVLISCIVVYRYGLVGVALGTLIGMFYQTFWMAKYNSRCILFSSLRKSIKLFLVDAIEIAVILISTRWIVLSEPTYFQWIIMATKVAFIALLESIAIQVLLCKSETLKAVKKIKQLFVKKVNR